jgi:hypothetical protein
MEAVCCCELHGVTTKAVLLRVKLSLCVIKHHVGNGGVTPCIFNLDIDGREGSALLPLKECPVPTGLGDRVGSRLDLEAVDTIKVPCPCRESNHGWTTELSWHQLLPGMREEQIETWAKRRAL